MYTTIILILLCALAWAYRAQLPAIFAAAMSGAKAVGTAAMWVVGLFKKKA